MDKFSSLQVIECLRSGVSSRHLSSAFAYGRDVAAQEEAVRMASTREITFIWGPPGTGKTETLARIAQLLNEQGERVLILSHANVAVDGAVLRTASLMGAKASL